jgi:hypothetical protein
VSLFPRMRTSAERSGMSAKCQQQTRGNRGTCTAELWCGPSKLRQRRNCESMHRAKKDSLVAHSRRWQTTQCPLPLSFSAGGSSAQSGSCRMGQRLWKGQPDGRRSAPGTSPITWLLGRGSAQLTAGPRYRDGEAPIVIRGSSEAVSILKNDLHVAAQRPQLRPVESRDVRAFKPHLARGWLDQTQDTAPGSGLAAAGFAH